MPLNATAPVTARDHFVVACTEEELQQRLAEFRDLSISDDEIRSRYFTRTRSTRYPLGDSRSWKLAAARRVIAADDDWQSKIIRCLYRPFDRRFVFWHPAMIDWPREYVTRHLIEGSGFRVQGSDECEMRSAECGISANSSALRTPHSALRTFLCLIARRQQLPTQPCSFFWIADGLALDGVIRSDNRGSESLFPLFVRGDTAETARWRANFAPAFLTEMRRAIGRDPEPESLLAYIYALFHAPSYRQRYAAELREDFPRVLLPTSEEQFGALSQLGRKLILWHTLDLAPQIAERHRGRSLQSAEGHRGERSRQTEDFRVGGYDVLRKWLQPKHRSPSDPHFSQIVAAVHATRELMARIDGILAD